MPYRELSFEEAAAYLHLSQSELEALVRDESIPCEWRGGRVVFRQREIDAWASQRILGLPGRRLAEYHQQSSRGTQAILPERALMPQMVREEFIRASLAAKTKASVLRAMVMLAESTGQVCDSRELLASLEEREKLCSTGLPGGLALLHPRHHLPYMFEASFLVLGRTSQQIPFGAPDGQPTDLFFLLCCQDDRLHLHTLARLCMMAQKTQLLARLRAAADAAAMFAALVEAEIEVLPKG